MMSTNVGVDTARRRQRRLRSWLRHERMTVAMTLAEKLHHTSRGQKLAMVGEEVVHDADDAPGGPKTPHPGVRLGSLAEPAPQRSDRSLRRSSGETPLLGVPSLADPSAEASDGRTLRFLLTKALALKKEEDEERRKQEEQEEFNSLYAMTVRTPQQDRWLADLYLLRAKRKRKKRRKRRTPRTSSRSLCGRARRRQRQWPVSGSPGDVLLRAVFPSTEMPCTMAGMDLKDRFSGMIKTGIDGHNAHCAVFSSWPIWTRRTVRFVRSSSFLAVACAQLVLLVTLLLALFSSLSSGPDARHLVRYGTD